MKRRDFLLTSSALAGAACLSTLPAWAAQTASDKPAAMRTRIIPSSGETVPVIGMGTSGSFEVPQGGNEYTALREVLKRTNKAGIGKVVALLSFRLIISSLRRMTRPLSPVPSGPPPK